MYSRDSRPRTVAALQAAFQAWIDARFGKRVALSTPVRKPRPVPAGQARACACPSSHGSCFQRLLCGLCLPVLQWLLKLFSVVGDCWCVANMIAEPIAGGGRRGQPAEAQSGQ